MGITVEDFRKEIKAYFEWFLPIKKEYGIECKYEILTKTDITTWNKAKDWNSKLSSMAKSLEFTQEQVESIYLELKLAEV